MMQTLEAAVPSAAAETVGLQPIPGGRLPEWVARHRAAWNGKPGLADYYRREIFDRIERVLASSVGGPGPILEIGTGPGLLARHRGDVIAMDVSDHDGVALCADAHSLPFSNGTLSAAIGVDVLHHLARPGDALAEIDRCLAPGGRFVLVEPWTGPIGFLFYRFIHHEDCTAVPDPFGAAFPPGKTPMDGNAWIPRAVLRDRPSERARHAPGLLPLACERFGGLSYLLTGGFQGWGAPAGLTRRLAWLENRLPDPLRALVSVRVLYAFEKRAAS